MMYVKKNIAYSTYYLTVLITELARIEVLKSNLVPQREVILQAIELNPQFFKKHYLDVIINEITLNKLEKNLEELEIYMDSIIEDIFQPVLKFLKTEGQPIGYSELWQKFTLQRREGWMNFNFLADKGIIERTLAPLHISGKSRATVYEPAFYYE